MIGLGFLSGIYPKIIGAALVVILIGGVYIYIQNLRQTIVEDKANIETLNKQVMDDQTVITGYQDVIQQKEKDTKLTQKLNGDISKKFKDVQIEKQGLIDRLAQLQLDAKNVTVPVYEKSINAISKDAMRCNELVTGATRTPDDLMNTICPELVVVK